MALMFVVQYGLAYHARQILAGATRDGAAAAARAAATPGDGEQVARQLVNDSAGPLLDDTTVTATSDGVTVTVTATGHVVAVLPFFGGVTVRATATAKPETFDPQGNTP